MENINRIIKRSVVFIIMLVFPVLIFNSCDTLDVQPSDSYTDAVIWEDQALVEGFANHAYRILPRFFEYDGWIMPYTFIVDENNARLSAGSGVTTILMGNHGPSSSGQLNLWSQENGRSYWPAIVHANTFLEKLAESSIDQSLKERLVAEMRVLRAYAYFRLISHYGGVPLITSTFGLDDDLMVARDSYDDVMNFVISELDEAMDSLPLEYDDANKGRLSKGAAMAIKARALLYAASPLNNPGNNMQKWQAARDANKAIIDLNHYELYPDYQELFQEKSGYHKEVIWGRPRNSDLDREIRIEQLFFPNGVAGFGQIHPLQNLVDDYEMTSGLLPENDPNYDPQDPYVNRDPRFYATILYDGAPFKDRTLETFIPGGIDSPEGPTSPWNATQTSYYVNKFIDHSESGRGYEGTSDPLGMRYRYAEVLLNYAEASFMLGDEATAREYINMVRSRPSVNMPDVTESGAALWDRIVNERRIELVFESHRFFDLRRWKIAEEVLSQTRTRMVVEKDPVTGERTFTVADYQPAKFNSWNYLAPIPQSEIDKNPLLEQNPGY
jgi:hypothetical protein